MGDILGYLIMGYVEAIALNKRVSDECIASGMWEDGVTTNYCIPLRNAKKTQWALPVLSGYEHFFTPYELSQMGDLPPDWNTTDLTLVVK